MSVTITSTGKANTGFLTGDGAVQEGVLDKRQAMDSFLASIERRGYQMARIALRDPDAALDLVQDAMIKLVRNYSAKPAAEWQPLFFRILKNLIIDYQRRSTVRNRVIAIFRPAAGEEAYDAVAAAPGNAADEPDRRVAAADAMAALEFAIAALPARQQQAFMLRTIEGMDVACTAEVMGCSASSVKTHLSRALSRLRAQLGEHYPE